MSGYSNGHLNLRSLTRSNEVRGEELITLDKLGPAEGLADFVHGTVRVVSIVTLSARRLHNARAWRAAHCTWNPFRVCFVAGTQVVIGEVLDKAPATPAAADTPAWNSAEEALLVRRFFVIP